jgi:hypothetical protein
LLIFKPLAKRLHLNTGKANHRVILGYFNLEVLDGAQGIKTRVYPNLYQRWAWFVARGERVIQLTLIEARLIAVVVTWTANIPTNRGAIFLRCRFNTSATRQA